MRRFFCPSPNIADKLITITDSKEIHHLKDVLRLKPKEEVVVFDGEGNEFTGLIKQLSGSAIVIEIKRKSFLKDGSVDITVAAALPKKHKFDEIIDRLTQLGVSRIIPLRTKRTIVTLDEKSEARRMLRWKKIAISAAKQSRRNKIPVIESICDFNRLISMTAEYQLKIIPTLDGKRKKLKDIFSRKSAGKILIIIGPEGDFTRDEIDLAKKFGCIPVSLGSLVLRTETACLAAVSFINLSLE